MQLLSGAADLPYAVPRTLITILSYYSWMLLSWASFSWTVVYVRGGKLAQAWHFILTLTFFFLGKCCLGAGKRRHGSNQAQWGLTIGCLSSSWLAVITCCAFIPVVWRHQMAPMAKLHGCGGEKGGVVIFYSGEIRILFIKCKEGSSPVEFDPAWCLSILCCDGGCYLFWMTTLTEVTTSSPCGLTVAVKGRRFGQRLPITDTAESLTHPLAIALE